MNTPNHTTHKSPMHPMMMAAAVAVVLFCAVGTAAVMGWLPSSIGGNNAQREIAAQTALAEKEAQEEKDEKADKARHTKHSTSSNTANTSHPAPVRHQPAPAPAPARSVCNNCGVIESVREIKTRAEGSGVGAAGGAVLGGLLGNQVGGGHGRQLATVAGAIGGAVAGNQIEGHVKASTSYDVTVRMENGESRVIHQNSQPNWSTGSQVRIVDGAIRSND
ncbi:outer membrane lipoprotein SlyB [Janthinobacterium sp. CG_23.3]|uniref:glycine zipper 2TM domain-containing protein n=1 Tax=unclassified Janthinobacterium TaxID=2610881 RepID=UPI000346C8CB|nr:MULTISPECIES: glycine zipper 2TM domain-containing protein [unclassified Janthinobacterium]MEC5163808.1 outer membrane lipoprotein SlyB [Janthinobacterium sp. CG_S6]